MVRSCSVLHLCAVLITVPAIAFAEDAGQRNKVIFVSASDAEPFMQALEGFHSIFPNAASIVLDRRDPAHTPALVATLASPFSLVIAAGRDAVDAVTAVKPDAPVLATMVLHADRQARSSWPALVVDLDTSPAQIAAEIAALFPKRHRIAVLWSGRGGESEKAAEAAYQHASIQAVECMSAGTLLPAFVSLRGKFDFVLTTPDAALYNSTTVKPLIMASLEHHLPIVGFSDSFVRSGAAVGIYPDFHDIGVQTALLAQKFLAGEVRKAQEPPRLPVVAVNQRILRLMGLDYKQRPGLVIFK